MARLSNIPAKICTTVCAFLIHDHKVLLVKHKKLGFWLAPGGHVEENELPHHAAEREFWEEAGIKVRVVSAVPVDPTETSENLPMPFINNLHWVSEKNYHARTAAKKSDDMTWQNGCEQHMNWMYLVEPVDDVRFQQNLEETDGIGWFSEDDLKNLETTEDIKQEIRAAFALTNARKGKNETTGN